MLLNTRVRGMTLYKLAVNYTIKQNLQILKTHHFLMTSLCCSGIFAPEVCHAPYPYGRDTPPCCAMCTFPTSTHSGCSHIPTVSDITLPARHGPFTPRKPTNAADQYIFIFQDHLVDVDHHTTGTPESFSPRSCMYILCVCRAPSPG